MVFKDKKYYVEKIKETALITVTGMSLGASLLFLFVLFM